MKNVTVFQLIFLCVFIAFIMAGLIVVTVYSKKSGVAGGDRIDVTMWGPLDWYAMQQVIGEINRTNRNMRITYVQKNIDSLDYELVEAIATGIGPDMVLLRQDSIVSNLSKIYPITADIYPVRTYKDTFLEEAELFLTPYGAVALPFAVDPLVMYWNRDIFSAAGVMTAPKTWDEAYFLASKLTDRSASSGEIRQSALALGEFSNISHAKDIMSALFIQGNNAITAWKPNSANVGISLGGQGATDPSAILSFYTQFSNPTKPVYSWNRSLPDSKSMFISGRLAIYFGLASEFKELRSKNPNLNFDVTYFPQAASGQRATFAELYGIVTLRSAKNGAGAIQVAMALSGQPAIAAWANVAYLPPVRRDMPAPPSDPYQTIFANSATIAKAWPDPNRYATDSIFKKMVESVTSGATIAEEAVGQAIAELRNYAP